MTAISNCFLHQRPVLRPNLYTLHRLFSSSDSVLPSGRETESESESGPKPSFPSYLNDVRATLQREPPLQKRPQSPGKPLSFSNSPHTRPPPSKSAYVEEIRRNLAEYRTRSPPPLPSSISGQYVSSQEIRKWNVIGKDDVSPTNFNNSAAKPPVGDSIDAIRESLHNFEPSRQSNQVTFSRFRESLNLKSSHNADPESQRILGEGDVLPSFFMKEINANVGEKSAMKTRLMRMYNYPELGKKLKMLRPEKKKKGKSFSLQELNERLAKLREIDDQESEGSVPGLSWKDLRESMANLTYVDEAKTRKKMMQRLDMLGQLGGSPSYLSSDPKDHLFEKYFHPDNMSSAEKLELKLKKVRDEFKMSESDCGSARVQVAQLTTKINHLSAVLHKKDKHSRGGLLAMVQRRKKLLKYLRRNDWDSYCLVLSQLSLRDSPDIKG